MKLFDIYEGVNSTTRSKQALGFLFGMVDLYRSGKAKVARHDIAAIIFGVEEPTLVDLTNTTRIATDLNKLGYLDVVYMNEEGKQAEKPSRYFKAFYSLSKPVKELFHP